MIRDLDASIRALLQGEAVPGSELATATISFAVPDDRWRGSAGAGLHLDVYLVRVEDDRSLRSNERRQVGGAVDEPLRRIACTYVVTAWNPERPVGGVDAEAAEHHLLSQALEVLLRSPALPLRYLVGSARTIEPTLVPAEPGGVADSADFWAGLGVPMRPSINLRVRTALPPVPVVTGPAVTTVAGPGDRLVIGGSIDGPDGPVAGAWVRLDETGATAVTDAEGRFTLPVPSAGTWRLLVRATGFQEAGGPTQVPDPRGSYDFVLDPM